MTRTTQILGLLSCTFLFTACGPSPAAVCDKMIELAKKEEGGEAIAKQLEEKKDECVKSMEKAKEMKGAMKFKEAANCIMDAEKFEDAMKCEK